MVLTEFRPSALTFHMLSSDLQEGEVILDVLFVLQDVGFKVHEAASVRLGPERGLG